MQYALQVVGWVVKITMFGWYVSRWVGGGGHLEPKRPVRRQVWSLTQILSCLFKKKSLIQRCMSFTEKIVVGIFSGKVMHSGKAMLDCT